MVKSKQPKKSKQSKKSKSAYTWSAQRVDRSSHLARNGIVSILFRKTPTFWIVKVPLTPFTAPQAPVRPVRELPQFFVYRADLLTDPRNQGDCGSCWAFMVCDVISDRLAILARAPQPPLSVQQLLECFSRKGCDGASPEKTAQWLETGRISLVPDDEYPYKGKNPTDEVCRSEEQNRGGYIGYIGYIARVQRVFSVATFIPEHGYDPVVLHANIVRMKSVLVESGPMYAAMAVYEDLFVYTGEAPYRPSGRGNPIGGHAVEIIGYCDAGEDPRFPSTGYWICKSSWAKDWPTRSADAGIFSIVMGENICGIESRVGYVIPYAQSPKSVQRRIDGDISFNSYGAFARAAEL